MTARRIAVCLLGLLLGLGVGLSAVQAGNMTVEMALAGDGCPGCGGDDAVKAGVCVAICAASVFIMPAPEGTVSQTDAAVKFLNRTRPLHGTVISPDPYPPKRATSL